MCNLYYIHRAHNLIHSSLIPPHYIYIFIYLYMYLLCWKFCFKADNTETMCALFKTAWQHLTWDQLIVCSWVQTWILHVSPSRPTTMPTSQVLNSEYLFLMLFTFWIAYYFWIFSEIDTNLKLATKTRYSRLVAFVFVFSYIVS